MLSRDTRARAPLLGALRVASAAEGVVVAAIVGVGADVLHPGSGLLLFGVALYVPTIIDRIRRAD